MGLPFPSSLSGCAVHGSVLVLSLVDEKEMSVKLIDVRSSVMDCVVHVTGLKLTMISLMILFQSIERK